MKKNWVSDALKALLCALALIAAVGYMEGGCRHTPPAPPGPLPPELCGLDDKGYDELSDKVVSALGDDLSWENRMTLLVTERTKPLLVCTVKNVLADLRDAPVEISRANEWLAKNDEVK